MNTIHDENKIEEMIKDFKSLYVDTSNINDFDRLKGIRDKEPLNFIRSALVEYAEYIREKTIDECIRLLRDENTMSEVIRETLGYGNHYSTMPVARGLVSRMEEKLKQLLT